MKLFRHSKHASDGVAFPLGAANTRVLRHPGVGSRDEETFDRDLKVAVESLPHVMRSSLLLKATLDHTYAEIAMMLGIPETTARSNVHRARKRILKALAPAAVGQTNE